MPNLPIAATLSTDPTVRTKLRAALVQKALAFMNAPKPPADPPAPLQQWRRRRALADRVLTNPDAIIESVAWLVGNDFAVLAAATSKIPAGNVADVDDPTLEAALAVALTMHLTLAARAADDAPVAAAAVVPPVV